MPSAPSFLQFAREFDHFVSVVAAGAGEHRNFAGRFFDRDLDHAQVFFAGERGAFAGGAAGDQKIDALSI
jgi:hypothetical protein